MEKKFSNMTIFFYYQLYTFLPKSSFIRVLEYICLPTMSIPNTISKYDVQDVSRKGK